MSWQASLVGDERDLARWAGALKPPHEPNVEVTPGGETVLLSTGFQGAATALELRERALKLIAELNGAFRLSAEIGPVRFGGAIEVDAHGERHRTVFAEAVMHIGPIEITATAEVRDSAGRLRPSPEPGPSSIQTIIAACLNDGHLSRALRHAGGEHEWYDLYKAIEEMVARAGGEAKVTTGTTISASEFGRMKRTANWHRHTDKYERPPKPMALAEARATLASVIEQAAGGIVR